MARRIPNRKDKKPATKAPAKKPATKKPGRPVATKRGAARKEARLTGAAAKRSDKQVRARMEARQQGDDTMGNS